QDHLNSRELLFWMLINWHTPPIITHFQRAIRMENHFELGGKTGNGLIDTIINDFLGQVIWPLSISIHARPLTHRFQTAYYSNYSINVAFTLNHLHTYAFVRRQKSIEY